MKLGLVVHRFPPAIGGSERYTEILAEKLTEAGHEVTVFTTQHPERATGTYPYTVCEFSNQVPEGFGYFGWPGIIRPAVLAELRELDAIHAVPANMFSAVVGAMASRLFNTTAILTTFYHPAQRQAHPRLKRLYDRLVLERVLPQYDALVVSSEFELRHLRADFDLSGCEVVRMDIPPTLEAPPTGDFRATHDVADAFLMLFVGRLDEHKGMNTLLPAVETASADIPSLRCVVVGETERWHEWPDTVAQTVEANRDRFVFTGPLTGGDLAAAYEAADFFVLPSEYETYGLVLTEALSYGTPVIATRVGIAPELITPGENGFLFDGSADALADQIRRIEGHDSAALQEGAQHSVAHLSWDKTISDLETLYGG